MKKIIRFFEGNFSNARALAAGLFLALLILANAPAARALEEGLQPAPATNRYSLTPVMEMLTNYISLYEPTYFIAGSYPGVEFQYSIKSQLFNTSNRYLSPVNHFYFAYTQTSFWDLFSKSPSFYDTSYKPSAFLSYEGLWHDRDAGRFRLDLQGGIEHESNGRGGVEERSMNTLYLQPAANFLFPQGWEVSFKPRVWAYVFGVSDNNPDISKYHGYADLLTTVSWNQNGKLPYNERFELATMLHIGREGNHGSARVDLSFSILQWTGFTPRIHAQYFIGDEQTLRQYNQFSTGYRIGISLFD